ncbi:hypothetical protein ACFE04_021205 [Oxalis oulophora]
MGKQLHNRGASIRVTSKISNNNIRQVVTSTTPLFNHQQQQIEESHVQIVTQNDSSNMQELQSKPSSTDSINMKKRTRGKYKSIRVDMKKKNGKLQVKIPDDILRAVGENARDIVNFCGFVVRANASLRAKNWIEIAGSSSRQMWLQVKERFFTEEDGQEFRLKAFKISTRNKANRAKKMGKHSCGPVSFAEVEESIRDAETGEKAPPDEVWFKQHTKITKEGALRWSDNKAEDVHSELKKIVNKPLEEGENSMTRDEMLLDVLGAKSRYFRGKGAGKKAPSKNAIGYVDVEDRVIKAIKEAKDFMIDDIKQEIRDEVIDEVRENLKVEIRAQMEIELDSLFQDRMAAFFASMSQRGTNTSQV